MTICLNSGIIEAAAELCAVRTSSPTPEPSGRGFLHVKEKKMSDQSDTVVLNPVETKPSKRRWRRFTSSMAKAGRAVVTAPGKAVRAIWRRIKRLSIAQYRFTKATVHQLIRVVGLSLAWLWITAWRLICLLVSPIWWIIGNAFYALFRGCENLYNLVSRDDAGLMHATYPAFSLRDAEAYALVAVYPVVCFLSWLLSPLTGKHWYVKQMNMYRSDAVHLADDAHWVLYAQMMPYPKSEFTGDEAEANGDSLPGVSNDRLGDVFRDVQVPDDPRSLTVADEVDATDPDAALALATQTLPDPASIADPRYRSYVLGRVWVRRAVEESAGAFLTDPAEHAKARALLAKQASAHNSGLRKGPALEGFEEELNAQVLANA